MSGLNDDVGGVGGGGSEDIDRDGVVEPEWVRRRRLAAVFGDVLPDQTNDDLPPSSHRDQGVGDDWFRDQVPPHHG